MRYTRKQRFGVITLIILIIASYLVTVEPWKKSSEELATALVTGMPPRTVRIQWNQLSDGYPQDTNADTIRTYLGFDLGYNEQFEQAAWVAYILTREEAEARTADRTDDFRTDTSIPTGSAALEDYRGSGFDRGHLAPAGDMKWDLRAMSETFLLSNMSPQDPSFNRGIWRRLEEQVRRWAIKKDSIYVITGPVLDPIDSLIGTNRVGVPAYYFKVLVDLSPPDHSLIAFLLPGTRSTDDLLSFAVSVDSLERFTGYDFFAGAPDQETVEWLEGRIYPDHWKID
ncbi:MAG: DNA/RNA non-specific endonuclease [Bacteroidales bacterium]